MEKYYREVKKNYIKLTKEEFDQALINNDSTLIFNATAPLVINIVNKYYQYSSIKEELIAEGNIAIITSINKYKVGQTDATFLTYVSVAIHNSINQYISSKINLIKKPKKNKKNIDIPTATSYDSFEKYDIIDEIEDNEIDDNIMLTNKKLTKYIKELKPKHQIIINKYIIQEKTFAEIAKEIGISKQAVQQQYQCAINKLKQKLTK